VKHEEILRAARSMLEEHGANVEIHIAKRADGMREAGDLDGCRLWLRILDALKEPEIANSSVG
jgi:hypothetical protein